MLHLRKFGTERSDDKRSETRDYSSIPIASTGPDWKAVDFTPALTTNADITDIPMGVNGIYTIYTLGENILFPSSGNDVCANGQSKLKMIGDVLDKRFKGATIGVFGSTDSLDPRRRTSNLANSGQKL